MNLQNELNKAFNRGIERAAKLAARKAFEIREADGKIHRWLVGKTIAEMIRTQKKKVSKP